MNIEHIKLFLRVATTNNISQAGNELGLSPAVASAHIHKLENHLGVRLIHRTTRKVSLTEEGINFLPYAEDVVASIDAARASIGVGEAKVSGTLRITAPASFGQQHIMPAMADFLACYPELVVDMHFSDTMVDLVEGGFDVAIRNATLKDSSLVARKLASDQRIITASPDYLKRHGIPLTPHDLTHHQCLKFSGIDKWEFKAADDKSISIKVQGPLRTDNGSALRQACVAGIGIGVNATWSVYEDIQSRKLVQILPDYPLANEAAIWAVYPSSRLLAPKVRAFIDYFADYYGEPPYWQR